MLMVFYRNDFFVQISLRNARVSEVKWVSLLQDFSACVCVCVCVCGNVCVCAYAYIYKLCKKGLAEKQFTILQIYSTVRFFFPQISHIAHVWNVVLGYNKIIVKHQEAVSGVDKVTSKASITEN